MRAKNKLVCGIGINDADYEVYTKVNGKKVTCPFYVKWKSMLERVYIQKYIEKRPSYAKVSVCDEWLTFSNFKAWMEKQDWQGKHLEKDIVGNGLIYSPDTCVFVHQHVNSFINDHKRASGEWPTGVSKRDRSKLKKFEAHCNVFDSGKSVKKFLGSFLTPDEAHLAWKAEKLKQAKNLAKTIGNDLVAKALVKRYE